MDFLFFPVTAPSSESHSRAVAEPSPLAALLFPASLLATTVQPSKVLSSSRCSPGPEPSMAPHTQERRKESCLSSIFEERVHSGLRRQNGC